MHVTETLKLTPSRVAYLNATLSLEESLLRFFGGGGAFVEANIRN
jgi:hypothetical protein